VIAELSGREHFPPMESFRLSRKIGKIMNKKIEEELSGVLYNKGLKKRVKKKKGALL